MGGSYSDYILRVRFPELVKDRLCKPCDGSTVVDSDCSVGYQECPNCDGSGYEKKKK